MKHIFKLACSQDPVGTGDLSHYNRVNLLSKDNKEITFCGPYFTIYRIYNNEDGIEFLDCRINEGERDIQEDEICASWVDKGVRNYSGVPLANVKVKVILDDHCEYQLSLSTNNGEKWITLPKMSLSKDLDLKKYYNKEINLSKGSQITTEEDIDDYAPKVMHGEEEICELSNICMACQGDKVKIDDTPYDDLRACPETRIRL